MESCLFNFIVAGNSYPQGISKIGLEHIETVRESIRMQVMDHLANCPKGLIVVDEAESMDINVLMVFQEFWEVPRFTYKSLFSNNLSFTL